MCGIAGLINLTERAPLPGGVLQAMAARIVHRGPDEDGYFERPGLGLASRRLSIVGLADGRQPISNEDRSVHCVFNGEFFDYPEQKARLEAKGHQFRTHCDTELIPHTYEDDQEGMFAHLRGQFAVALWDQNRQRLILGRDRWGICPLFWTRQKTKTGEWLLFASEIKALLASGMVEARPDPRGINHTFTFFAHPGPNTCFEGIQQLLPGHYLTIQLDGGGNGRVTDQAYFSIDFPDWGDEERGDAPKVIDQFEEVMLGAVEKRLRADVPVVSYLSGGVDSSVVVALACKIRGKPIPTFTIQIKDPQLDETSEAGVVARHLNAEPIIVPFGAAETLNVYPRLIEAAEAPVIDTSAGALLLLAQEVHARGYKVALTGEGADEWLGGYPWFKTHRLLSFLDMVPGVRLSGKVRELLVKLTGPRGANPKALYRIENTVGGPNAWLDIYGPMSLNKPRFFSQQLFDQLGGHLAYDDLQIDASRVRRWHPLNRSLYLGGRIHLAGHLLCSKGDRVAMNNSVETRYPFLDEDVYAFLAKLDPRWKMKGFGDKHILRKLAERWLPPEIAWRRKWMFRAPFDTFHSDQLPPFIAQLLSDESIRKTGYFDPQAVEHWGQAFRKMRPGSYQRTLVEMGLVGVVATQLWHHTFIDPTLADLPGLEKVKPARVA